VEKGKLGGRGEVTERKWGAWGTGLRGVKKNVGGKKGVRLCKKRQTRQDGKESDISNEGLFEK